MNAAGSPVDPAPAGSGPTASIGSPAPTASAERDALGRRRTPRPGRSLNTTIGVVLTDATLTKAQAGKVAAVAHDGLARADPTRCTR